MYPLKQQRKVNQRISERPWKSGIVKDNGETQELCDDTVHSHKMNQETTKDCQ